MGFFSSLAGAVAGPLIGGAFGLLGGERRNLAAASAADRQMEFQKEMFKHRYQYQMADMRKAGLNPILAYSQGPPSAPTGASYDPVNVAEPLAKGIDSAVTSGLAAFRLNTEVKKLQAEVDKAEADAEKARAEAGLRKEETKTEPIRRWLMDNQADQAHSGARLADQNRMIAEIQEKQAWQQLTIMEKEAIIAGIEAGFYESSIGEISKVLEKMGLRPTDAAAIGKLLLQIMRPPPPPRASPQIHLNMGK